MSTVPGASQGGSSPKALCSEGLSRTPSNVDDDSSVVFEKSVIRSNTTITSLKRKAETAGEVTSFRKLRAGNPRVVFKIPTLPAAKPTEIPRNLEIEICKTLPEAQEKSANSAEVAVEQGIVTRPQCPPRSSDSNPELLKTFHEVAVQTEFVSSNPKPIQFRKAVVLSDKAVATENQETVAKSSPVASLVTLDASQVTLGLGENVGQHTEVEFDPNWDKELAELNGRLIRNWAHLNGLKSNIIQLEETLEALASSERKYSAPWEKIVKEIDELVESQMTIQQKCVSTYKAVNQVDVERAKLRNQHRERQMKIMQAGKLVDSRVLENYKEFSEDALHAKRGELLEKMGKLREKLQDERLKLSKAEEEKKLLETQISRNFEEFSSAKHRLDAQEKERLACRQELSHIQAQILALKGKELMYRLQLIKKEPVGTLVFPWETIMDEMATGGDKTSEAGMVVPSEIVHDFMHTLVVFRSAIVESAEDPTLIWNENLDRIKIKSVFERMMIYFPGSFSDSNINYVLRVWRKQLSGLNVCNMCLTMVDGFEPCSVKRVIRDIRQFYVLERYTQNLSRASPTSAPSTPATPSLRMPPLHARTVSTGTPLVECTICRQLTSMSCACQTVAYCSTDCQMQDFARHQDECRECQLLATECENAA